MWVLCTIHLNVTREGNATTAGAGKRWQHEHSSCQALGRSETAVVAASSNHAHPVTSGLVWWCFASVSVSVSVAAAVAAGVSVCDKLVAGCCLVLVATRFCFHIFFLAVSVSVAVSVSAAGSRQQAAGGSSGISSRSCLPACQSICICGASLLCCCYWCCLCRCRRCCRRL